MEETEKTDEKKPEETDNSSSDAKEEASDEADSNKIKEVEEAKQAAVDMKKENDRKEKLIEKEEKLLTRQESIKALGGGSLAGTESSKPQFTDEEKASRARIKAVGDTSNAAWAKNYE